jgi:molybdopterin/thiamine biosynthesis adenylyltransferase
MMTSMETDNTEISRDEALLHTLGQELYDKITKSRVLLVGAGGIGCEVLKNLVLGGFRHVEVVRFHLLSTNETRWTSTRLT